MPTKNPPHPGRSIRGKRLDALGLNVSGDGEGVRCGPSHAFVCPEWAFGDFTGDDDSAGESGMVQRRVPAATAHRL